MVPVQVLGESWQFRHQSKESPFEIGRKVEHFKRVRRIFLLVLVAILALVLIGTMLATGTSLHLDPNPLVIILIALAVVAYFVAGFGVTPTQRQWFQVWSEFKRHHDVLVEDLDIRAASTSISDICRRSNKRLEKQKDEILHWHEVRNAGKEASVPTADEINKFHSKVVAYWRLRQACEYLGWDEETEWTVFLDGTWSTRTRSDSTDGLLD